MNVVIKRKDAHSSKTTTAIQHPENGPPMDSNLDDGAEPAALSNGLVRFQSCMSIEGEAPVQMVHSGCLGTGPGKCHHREAFADWGPSAA